MSLQLTFDFYKPETQVEKRKKKRTKVNYEELYKEIQKHPMTFSEIKNFLGTTYANTAQAIDLLSIKYPIWCPARGLYKVLTEEDFQND